MMPSHEANVELNEVKLAKEGIIRPDIGAAAPAVATLDDTGQLFSLSSALAAKKYVVLFFYPANDTPNTAKHLMALSKAATALALQNVQVYAMNPGARADGTAFLAKYSVKVPLLDDPAHMFAVAYGCALDASSFPQRTLVGINPEGKIVMFYRGFFPGADPTQAILKQLGLVAPKSNSAATPPAAETTPAPAPATATPQPPATTAPPDNAAPPTEPAPGSAAPGK